MKRRDFIGITGGMVMATGGMVKAREAQRLHIVTLSFDDGFRKSFIRTAEIYEKFSLSACFNIVAMGHVPGMLVDDYALTRLIGEWSLWNELQERGHEVMPHGYRHAHLRDLPLDEAKGLVTKCLEVFSKELRGFDPKKAVFNFPYNQSSPELEAWLPSQVRAFRTTGGEVNPLPTSATVKITTSGYGPTNCEAHLDRVLGRFLEGPSGWFVYNVHGLDEEGWGPIRASYLEKLIGRLVEIDSVRILPAWRALMQGEII